MVPKSKFMIKWQIVKRKKFIVPVSVVLFLLIVVIGEFYYLQRYREEKRVLQNKLNALSTEASVLRRKIRDSENKLSDMEKKLREKKLKIDSLSQKLEKEKKARLDTFQRLISLESRLKEEKAAAQRTKENLAQALKEVEELKQKVQSLTAEKEHLTVQLQKLTAKKVSLGSVVVGSSGKQEPSSRRVVNVEGKVIAVVKEYSFCVISVGSINGVREGDLFSLYHGSRYLGDIKIDKVRKSLAAGEFLSSSLPRLLKKGDRAVYKSPAK